MVRVMDGVARIAGFRSVLGWLDRHEPLLLQEMEALGLLWQQRAGMAGAAAGITPPA